MFPNQVEESGGQDNEAMDPVEEMAQSPLSIAMEETAEMMGDAEATFRPGWSVGDDLGKGRS